MHRGINIFAVNGRIVGGVHCGKPAVAAGGTFPLGTQRIDQRAVVLGTADDFATGRTFAGTAVELRYSQIIVKILPSGNGIGICSKHIAGAKKSAVIAKIHYRV